MFDLKKNTEQIKRLSLKDQKGIYKVWKKLKGIYKVWKKLLAVTVDEDAKKVLKRELRWLKKSILKKKGGK